MRSSSIVDVWNATRSTYVCEAVQLADTSISRFVSLLGMRSLPESAGLPIRLSSGVHTLAMAQRAAIG